MLQSLNTGKYYIGFTENIQRRFLEHQSGNSVFDRTYGPFSLVLTEKYSDKKLAMKREKQIKSYKGGNSFKVLIGGVPR
ncbi:GIY-YIG nuclease family protein [Candidatus Shapirobacteria bacterium]|nr:GIY-YIG nuclease family protein [Candidatus Shapirobacteria bacterium]